jgi:serine/threonine-protein kinase
VIEPPPPAPVGPAPRYEPLVKIASGGMATVFVGALRGPLGFQQLVAIKRPHEHLLEDPKFREAMLAEARVASRIHHANVVDVRDLEVVGESIQLIMDYVEGAALGQLIVIAARTGALIPAAIAVRIALDACAGLHAVHELTDGEGAPLDLVHRDISPQNILVGLDGVARVTDFGVAKEAESPGTPTAQGTLKGKLGYLAPEYVRGGRVDRRIDVFAMGVVLWEALTHRRLFRGANEGDTLDRVLHEEAPPVSGVAEGLGGALDPVVAKALAKRPEERFQSALELSCALEEAARSAGLQAGHADVARLLREAVGEELEQRRLVVRERLAASASASAGLLATVETGTPAAPAQATSANMVRRTMGRVPRWAAALMIAGMIAAIGGAARMVWLAQSTQGPEPGPVILEAAREHAAQEPAFTAEAAPSPQAIAAPPGSASARSSQEEPASARSAAAQPGPPATRASASGTRRAGAKPLPPNPYTR